MFRKCHYSLLPSFVIISATESLGRGREMAQRDVSAIKADDRGEDVPGSGAGEI